MDLIEEWNKLNPKVGLADSKNPNNLKKVNVHRAKYGNYIFRNALSEVLTLIDDSYTVVTVGKSNTQYFNVLQKNLRSIIKQMVKML